MLLAATTQISLSAGLLVGTAASLAMFVLLGWLVLVVVPRHLSGRPRR
jgi:hypothetical protein